MILKHLLVAFGALLVLSGCGGTPVKKSAEIRSDAPNKVAPASIEEAPMVEPPTVANGIVPAVTDGSSTTKPMPVSAQTDMETPGPSSSPEPLSEKDSMTSVTVDADLVEKLVLMNGSGPLEICRDAEATTISFSAEVVSRAVGLDRARALAAGVRIALDNTAPGRYRARIIEPELAEREECSIEMKVILPADESIDFDLDIQDSEGAIVIDGFRGNLSITSLEGPIEIYQAAGNVDISGGSGPCEIVGVTGSLKIRDGAEACRVSEISGSVEIWGREGTLEARYITGDVLLIDGRDGAVVQSVEGDVTLYGIEPARCNIEGVSGSVIYKTGAP